MKKKIVFIASMLLTVSSFAESNGTTGSRTGDDGVTSIGEAASSKRSGLASANDMAEVAAEVKADKLQVYPNPTSDFVYINNNGAEVKVYNHVGVLLQRTNDSRIDLSSYPRGIYLLRTGEALKVMKK